MPEIEIGPFTSVTGPEGAKETVRFLRIGSYSGNSVVVPDDLTDTGQIMELLGSFLQGHEDRITDLLIAFRQGDISIETNTKGELTHVFFRYPDFAEPQIGRKPS